MKRALVGLLVLAAVAAACSPSGHKAAPPPPSCAQAAQSGSVETLMAAFEHARALGRGAEGCLGGQATSAYCGPRKCSQAEFDRTPGPLCLYSCNGYAVSKLTWHVAPGGSVDVLTSFTEEAPEGRPPSSVEHLAVSGNIIVGATTTA